jgi:transcriptional regulator with XRE-family HTH domain
MQDQAATEIEKTGNKILCVSNQVGRTMPKQKNPEAVTFGQRLAALRKAAGYTQQDLADAVGVSRRMVAYYEGQSEHPPTTLVPAIAQALGVTIDELFGVAVAKPRNGRTPDTRLQRRLQQIERMPARDKRQVLQVLDAFIERAQLKADA